MGRFWNVQPTFTDCGTLEGFLCGAQNVWYSVEPNKEIITKHGAFRPDFLFKVFEPDTNTYGPVVFLFGAEVDGHDFHERTRQQVQRDKSRDRSLLHAGVKLLRFSGSEVFHSVDDVLNEISDFIFVEGRRHCLWDFYTGTVDDWDVRKAMRPERPYI